MLLVSCSSNFTVLMNHFGFFLSVARTIMVTVCQKCVCVCVCDVVPTLTNLTPLLLGGDVD